MGFIDWQLAHADDNQAPLLISMKIDGQIDTLIDRMQLIVLRLLCKVQLIFYFIYYLSKLIFYFNHC